MILMATLSLAGAGICWAISRAPLWQLVSISIDQGLEAGAHDAADRP